MRRQTDSPLPLAVSRALAGALVLANVAVLGLVAPEAQAAVVGRLTVGSALGQPLVAEIEVSSSNAADLASLSARLAAPGAYRAANLEYAPDLGRVEFTVIPRGAGQAVIRMASPTPMTEPALSLLIDFSWASGKLQRQFALLLDPPGYGSQAGAVTLTVPTPTPLSGSAPSVLPLPGGTAARSDRGPSTPGAAMPSAPSQYGPVKPGETLGDIAQRLRPAGAALLQVLAALYAENPGAFQGENMNRLKAGSVLRVPSSDQVNAISLADAQKLATAHRAALPAAVDSAGPPSTATGSDSLKVSRGPVEGRGAASASLPDRQDDLTAREQSLKDARARLADLQQQVREVERLIALAGAGAAPGQAAAGSAQGVAVAGVPVAAVDPPIVAPVAPPAPAAARAPAPPPAEPSLLERLQGDLLWLVAVVVVALGAGLIVLLRRRRAAAFSASAPGMPDGPRAKAPPRSASALPQPATPREPEFLAALDRGRPSAQPVAAADPVAEADSLITYGRYDQAEAVLKAALAAPGNQPQVALRLLELYHAKNDAKSFEPAARALRHSVGASSAIWDRASELGALIDPGNPLYAREGTAGARAAPSSVGTRLDLAKAYLEIGDKAGAQALLQNVATSGDEAQRAEAQKLLGSL